MHTKKLLITGDVHGEPIERLSTKSLFKAGFIPSDIGAVIIAGDFGVIWDQTESKEERYTLDWLASRPWTTYFIDGNHENFDRLNAFPENKDRMGVIVPDKVFHLKRGGLYDIMGKRVFTIGGGLSIDKVYRIEGQSWWKEELLTKAEEDYCLDILTGMMKSPDLIVTHAAPLSVLHRINFLVNSKFDDPTCKFLEYIKKTFTIGSEVPWYFGHYHVDLDWDDNFRAIYEDIVEV